MRESEKRLLIQESEVKPNRYVGKAMCVISAVAAFVLLLDELGFFHVDRVTMRWSIGISLVLLLVPQGLMASRRLAEKPALKYCVMLSLISVTLVLSVLLNFNVTLVLLLP